MENFDPDDPRASYQLVADTIRARIEDGTYPVGHKLPPHQVVADEFGVSVGTLKRAYALLQDARLISTRQGMGTFIRQQHAEPATDAPNRPATLEDAFVQIEALNARLAAVERQVGLHD
ncbi:winged helix-turn-helix domain-containing protein [Amycolatopsis sp. NBC_01488]|uniref:winged helix-turn-helix domain-containing protein n=1 Tax=Amycolatopsis sp. NBC_01488 TaxID=2903563 RepID=UPI002E282E1D|nr:winged helix-turn-helix domain-containing protein [Amycolatopsis sp. NBC_01488]